MADCGKWNYKKQIDGNRTNNKIENLKLFKNNRLHLIFHNKSKKL